MQTVQSRLVDMTTVGHKLHWNWLRKVSNDHQIRQTCIGSDITPLWHQWSEQFWCVFCERFRSKML